MNAIVTDARYRFSLAAIRSLGRAGVRVIAQEERGIDGLAALGFHSRHTAERMLTASPRTAPQAFVDDLLSQAGEGDVVIPTSLASIRAIAGRLDEVRSRLRAVVPSPSAIETADDTQRLLAIAERVGVRAPRTMVLPPGGDPIAQKAQLKFPVVVKYREGETLGLPPQQRYAIIRDPEQFATTYQAMAARQESPLVQEYIAGDGWGMSALFDAQSEPVAVFCHRRLREYPVSGGPSCFAESVHDDKLIEAGLRLLRELRWQGIAMVEFKREFATGDFVLMEINPRFWGSMPLAIAAGVDFPHLLYRVASGEKVTPVTTYRLGVRMRYLFQDLLSVRGYMRRAENPGRFLRGYLGDLFDPRVVDGVFRLDDPRPGFAYLLRALRKASRRGGEE